MDLLQRLNAEQGQTIVMVTHDPAIGARAHRIVRFRDGEIVGEERPARNGVAPIQDQAMPALALA
jgi:putative ABC transport system ATP-binding protein